MFDLQSSNFRSCQTAIVELLQLSKLCNLCQHQLHCKKAKKCLGDHLEHLGLKKARTNFENKKDFSQSFVYHFFKNSYDVLGINFWREISLTE